jgi:hypothetical protein
MKRAFHLGLVAVLAAETLVVAQNAEVTRILAAVRTALGGERALAAVQTMDVEGTRTRAREDGTSRASAFSMAFALPDRFVKQEAMAEIGGMTISRSTGFNGAGLIDEVETPPQMGGMMVFRGPGGGAPDGEMTPEQQAREREDAMTARRHEFARLSLGMLAASTPAFPVEFAYVGEAESPDGKADVLDVTGEGGFAVRLFVDQKSHLPLMLSWMDREPLTMVAGGGPGVMTMSAGGGHATTGSGGRASAVGSGSPEDVAKMRADMDAHMKEADAKRRVVEYRLFYSDYKAFDGVKVPTRIQQMIDGQPTEELQFEKIKVNGTIDPKRFVVKESGQ